ncbi:hypothetical protein EMIHUDRAFT_231915 [Emiliania huxleyi CCMP1516]|uniref:CCHC-type domain-containing protein n=2 Tax=Emiliania huxleyi TaxID=2903 RepID=A0A0D3K6W7_EMIH1|nr:hypothetical protein EMIHUDRAFT_231915 [Emiliania huxleyi CCMP1516]EOD31502.1 hypothetical protein EMIHUDRAFT_231915 [Emiliania huxleyi CCMP1516]|eukprot:XP_005783931.1 hypothetical protein EMIHUDRAFT_231915 [Emiliania huxleyi CCMP1516]
MMPAPSEANGWSCPRCARNNPARVAVCTSRGCHVYFCFKCSRTGHLQADCLYRVNGTAKGASGEVRAGDWACDVCGNHNFASKATLTASPLSSYSVTDAAPWLDRPA